MKNMQAGGCMSDLMLLNSVCSCSKTHIIIEWDGNNLTLSFVGDCVEDITMHAVVYKFQSERDGVHMHPLPTGLVHVHVIAFNRISTCKCIRHRPPVSFLSTVSQSWSHNKFNETQEFSIHSWGVNNYAHMCMIILLHR